MRSREKAAVLAILHIFAIGFQYAGGCACLGKNLPQHFQIEVERRAESKSLRQPRGEIVAQLMNSLPRAFTSRLSPLPAKMFRIALSSVTTVKITSDSAVTSDKSWAAAQPSSAASDVAIARLVS